MSRRTLDIIVSVATYDPTNLEGLRAHMILPLKGLDNVWLPSEVTRHQRSAIYGSLISTSRIPAFSTGSPPLASISNLSLFPNIPLPYAIRLSVSTTYFGSYVRLLPDRMLQFLLVFGEALLGAHDPVCGSCMCLAFLLVCS
jgi:hypothetical protein